MKRKYNIALLPLNKNHVMLSLAKGIDSIASTYSLSENSYPHLTLCQFEADEGQIEDFWLKIITTLEKTTFDIILDKWSYLTFDNQIFWISLLPTSAEHLNQLHVQIAKIINEPIKLNYDPHVTLINSTLKTYKDIAKNILPREIEITDSYSLSLGLSDDVGQFIKKIF